MCEWARAGAPPALIGRLAAEMDQQINQRDDFRDDTGQLRWLGRKAHRWRQPPAILFNGLSRARAEQVSVKVSQREVADYLSLHYSAVSRLMKEGEA